MLLLRKNVPPLIKNWQNCKTSSYEKTCWLTQYLKITPNMSVPHTNQDIFNVLQPQARRADQHSAEHVAFLPDPDAHAIDAFSIHWGQSLSTASLLSAF